MNKKLLMIGLILTLVLTALIPAPALADSPKAPPTPQPFGALANVAVTNPGTSTAVGTRIITRGEIIEGIITQVDNWPALQGATLKVRHNSEITLATFLQLVLRGYSFRAYRETAKIPLKHSLCFH